MSDLILFTNRSGSTFFADILAYTNKTVNLGEGLHSIVRPYNWNTEANRQASIYKQFASDNISSRHYNRQTRGFDHIGFVNNQQKRVSSLISTDVQWTAKLNLDKQNFNYEVVEHCSKNNIKIYITHREDIVGQFISTLNARYRLEIANSKEDNFIYTNNHPGHPDYGVMKIPFIWLHMYTNIFIDQLLMWRAVYEMYKPYLQLVSYEKHIKPTNLQQFGISSSIIEQYKKESQHLVPTPHNSSNFQVTDDQVDNLPSAWDSALYYIQRHKHLVEI